MAPIVSPKLLSQILMHGYAAEICKTSYVKVLYADLKARPVAVCKPTVVIIGSVLPRPREPLAPRLNMASFTSLPNSTFILDPEDSFSRVSLASEECSLISSSQTTSLSDLDSKGGGLGQVTSESESTDTLEDYPETGFIPTSVSSTPSTVPSATSASSTCEPPSTAATSIPPWEASKSLSGPLRRFGAPPVSGRIRGRSPVDSLDIIRYRRASEATGAKSSNVFISRVRKYSDVRRLKGFGLRGLEIFKKVKW